MIIFFWYNKAIYKTDRFIYWIKQNFASLKE